MTDPMSDEDVVTKLKLQRDQLILLRLAITVKPKPSYDIDGQSVSWTEYLNILNKSIAAIVENLSELSPPFEEETQFYV